LSKPEVDTIMSKYFVTVTLDVHESEGKKHLENPGGEEYLNANGGKNQGLPFLYFSDSKGKLIVNSMRPAKGADKGGNVGCPYEPEEIGHFMAMIKKAAPKMTEEERGKIQVAFEAMKKADKKGG